MSNNDWLDIDILEDYLDGKLDAKAMHRVERISLEDPFVAEALAGLGKSPRRAQSLSILQKQLQDRIAQKPVEEKRWRITAQRLSIAAAAAVLFVTVSVLFWMRESNSREQIAGNSAKKVDVKIAPIAPNPTASETQKTEIDRAIAASKTDAYAKLNKKTIPNPPAPTPLASIQQSPVENTTGIQARSSATEENVFAKSKIAAKESAAAPSFSSVADISSFVPPKYVVKGTVLAAEDKLPIVGALVKLNDGKLSTSTNDKGEFSLSLDSLSKNQQLNIAYLGYMSKQIEAKPNQNLKVELSPSNQALNEVVVAAVAKDVQKREQGSDLKAKSLSTRVNPMEAYQSYLKANNKLTKTQSIGKEVGLRFEINKDGVPFNFKILNSLGKKYDDEAIRLVKDGPKWIFSPNGNNVIDLQVQF